MITDEQFAAWLKSESAIRCVLMEVVGLVGDVETTHYLSNRVYVTGGGDAPSNTSYLPIIVGGVQFTETLSLDGSASLSFGDIEITNPSGERDAWLDYIWKNRTVKMFVGDIRWPKSDFRLIFDGIVTDIGSRRRDRLNLTLSDKMQRLNTPVSEAKVGGTGDNADRLIPLLFGECHNIEPLLVDPAYHEYQIHNGPIEHIIEVRDNGVPVSFTPYLSTGKFRLNQSPAGMITCSAQGDKPSTYTNNASNLIKRLVTGFGKELDRFTTSDLDTANFDAYAASHTQPVGMYLTDRANVIEVCNQLASSVGCALMMTRAGLLKLVEIKLPRDSAGTTVEAKDMHQHSLEIAARIPVKAAVKIGYCKNYTVQDDLQTGIPSSHKDLFEQEWLTVTAADAAVATKYKLFLEPEQEDTHLLLKADAQAEALRRLNLYKVQRTTFKFSALPHLILQELGGSMTLKHERYGLSDGKSGQIVAITTDWINTKANIEVMI